MADEMKLWMFDRAKALRECRAGRLELEEDLEKWVAADIGLLSQDLIVIGRQVDTGVCGVIDLLCLSSGGDAVVVELKRDRTPRTVVAQVLDYGSWITGLSAERIVEIGDAYFGGTGELAEAFRTRFGSPLPEVLNSAHQLLVVGSSLDPASERIMRYLSEEYGVPVNFAGFQVFESPEKSGRSLLGRVFLRQPNDPAQPPGGRSKRRPNLTLEQLHSAATERGVGAVYESLFAVVDQLCDAKSTTLTSVSFKVKIDGSMKAVFNLIPTDSSEENGLHFQVYDTRFEARFGLSSSALRALLPTSTIEWAYVGLTDEDHHGFEGWFANEAECLVFSGGLQAVTAGRHGEPPAAE